MGFFRYIGKYFRLHSSRQPGGLSGYTAEEANSTAEIICVDPRLIEVGQRLCAESGDLEVKVDKGD